MTQHPVRLDLKDMSLTGDLSLPTLVEPDEVQGRAASARMGSIKPSNRE